MLEFQTGKELSEKYGITLYLINIWEEQSVINIWEEHTLSGKVSVWDFAKVWERTNVDSRFSPSFPVSLINICKKHTAVWFCCKMRSNSGRNLSKIQSECFPIKQQTTQEPPVASRQLDALDFCDLSKGFQKSWVFGKQFWILFSLKTFCVPMLPVSFSKSWVGVDEILCGGEGRAVGFWEDFPGQGAGWINSTRF